MHSSWETVRAERFPISGNDRRNNNSFPKNLRFFVLQRTGSLFVTLCWIEWRERGKLYKLKNGTVCARLSLSKKCLLQKCMLYLSGFDISKEDLAGLVLLLCVNLQFSWQRNFNFKRMGKWVYDNSTSQQALQCVVRNKLIKTWIWAPSFCQV